jgi:hypothetical protein
MILTMYKRLSLVGRVGLRIEGGVKGRAELIVKLGWEIEVCILEYRNS